MFWKRKLDTSPPDWMLVGLGNPGAEYRGTRHNVGFAVIDRLAEQHRIKLDRSRHRARYGAGLIGDSRVLLVKPMTYMNLSGQAVAPLAREHEIAPQRILVISDDLDLELGRTRLKPKGGAGGHNGHRSIIAGLGTQDYPRLRIGIGSVEKSETVDHVLGPFTPKERELIDEAIERAARAAEATVREGIEKGLSVANEGG